LAVVLLERRGDARAAVFPADRHALLRHEGVDPLLAAVGERAPGALLQAKRGGGAKHRSPRRRACHEGLLDLKRGPGGAAREARHHGVGDEGARTPGLRLAKPSLSQLSYVPGKRKSTRSPPSVTPRRARAAP